MGSLLARAGGALTDRFGPRPVLLGSLALTALGTLPFLFTGDGVSAVLLGAALVVRGTGLSTVNIAVMTGAYRDLTPAQVPHASTATRIAQQLGASFGTALLAVILASQLAAHPSAMATAYGHTFGWALVLTLLAFIPVLAMPAIRRQEYDEGMTQPVKRKVSITLDADLVAALEADSSTTLSAEVNSALRAELIRRKRQQALAGLLDHLAVERGRLDTAEDEAEVARYMRLLGGSALEPGELRAG